MRLLLSICLLFVFRLEVHAQSDAGIPLRIPPKGYTASPGDTLLVRRLAEAASLLIEKPGENTADLENARQLLDAAIDLCTQLKDEKAKLTVHKLRADWAYWSQNWAELTKELQWVAPQHRLGLVRILTGYYAQQSKDQHASDSILHYAFLMKEYATKFRDHSTANEAQYYIALGYLRKNQLKEGKRHFLKMADYHRGNNDRDNEIFVWQALAATLTGDDTTHPTKKECLFRVIELSRASKNNRRLVIGLSDMGELLIWKGELDAAEVFMLELDTLQATIGETKRYKTFEILSKLYEAKRNEAKALFYAKEALTNAQITENSPQLNGIYEGRLAEVEASFQKPDKFQEQLSKITNGMPPDQLKNWFTILAYATALSESKGAVTAIKYLLERRDKIPVQTERYAIEFDKHMGQFYLAAGDYHKAIYYLNDAEKKLPAMDYQLDNLTSDIYYLLANVSYEMGHYQQALLYLQKGESKVPRARLQLTRQIHAEFMWYKVNNSLHQYLNAIRHFSEHKRLSDSLFNSEKMGQLEALNVRYQMAKRQQELDQKANEIVWLTETGRLRETLLNETRTNARRRDQLQRGYIASAQSQARQRGDSLKHAEETYSLLNREWGLQKNLLKQARNTRNLIFGGGVLLVLLLVLIFSRYRLKQRSNRQLEKQRELISDKNASLQKLLGEKEWLLKEVHHRVKNNLQVVMSLLNIQSYYLQDDTAISAIRDSQHRVNAISLIHKKLYQSDNPAMVDMPHYIKELTEHLSEYADQSRLVRFDLNIDDIVLDIGKALPIGLILNESITNCFKYAFNGRQEGLISVRMHEDYNGSITLLIADDGIGIVDNDRVREGDSLGMSLMKGLASDMDGTLMINSAEGRGTTITVLFKPEDKKAAV
ncbi:histidine kinase dimerization/phosphoacceptor domain -containing protein [uncultured Chitinophaga sp.]|uniref:sensor histidine kinase n=1 Tax=uncultured Chitinophaga sp. TaxID=339340 RepID=UPI0025D8300A|nr:histidine kinase dimerization/phosphoacceptor domain -containing protein [uncultured Chitinophaga sp.]